MTKKRVTAAFALLVAAALLVSLLPLLPFSMPQAVAEQLSLIHILTLPTTPYV